MNVTRPFPFLGSALLAVALCLPAVALAQAPAEPTPTAAPTTPPGAPPGPLKITLRWTTASEIDNYGFFVMRSDLEAGPFGALHAKAIPGAGNSEMPHNYAYDDAAVEWGRTYYYYVESISTRGEKEKFTPVIARQCCKLPGTPTPTQSPASSPPPATAPSGPR